MVVPAEKATGIQPCKFYGSSLPRPRIYTNPQFNDERIDPPLSVADPLLSWAKEAHWSMGGLSVNRLRLQGRIEGNINKLRIQREKLEKKKSPKAKKRSGRVQKRVGSESQPPAPVAVKRRRLLDLNGEDDEIDGEVEKRVKGIVRKLGEDFDRVADQKERGKVRVKMSRGEVNGDEGKKVGKEKSRIRKSPRLAKLRES